MHTCLPFLVFFISTQKSNFPSTLVFSLDWKTAFIISASTALLMNSLGFHLSENVLISPSYVKNIFPRDWVLSWKLSFVLFSALNCCPADSWCPLFLMRTQWSSLLCSPKGSASANSDGFQDFLFILCFQYSDYNATTCDFSLYLSSLGFTELLESVNFVYLQILKMSVTFSLSSFPSPFSVFSPRIPNTHVKPCHVVPQITEVLFCCFLSF